jgi:hypothetical protein
MNVRFEGKNGHDADVTRCLLMTQSGHFVVDPSSCSWSGSGLLSHLLEDPLPDTALMRLHQQTRQQGARA